MHDAVRSSLQYQLPQFMEKAKTSISGKVFSYYRDFARSNSWYAISSYCLFALAFACTEILRPYIVKYIIDGTIAHTVTPVTAR